MIPIKLTLKNFMSYGAEPVVVPFEGLHVACLSGDNGNGKSALLDAMTYALWGKTRASSVKAITEDDLIRVGADDLEVRFEFELNAQQYRAIRKRRRGKSGDLQFAALDNQGQWVAAGGGSSRDTGRQIIQLLSMEYETFLNSAYLQQGHADEFTRQTPDNRKRILGEILGLDRYDRLETKAKERAKTRKEEADELNREIQMLGGQIDSLPANRADLTATQQTLTDAEDRIATQTEQTQQLRERVQQLNIIANSAANLANQLQKADADIAQRERERCDRLVRLKGIQQTLDQREAIESDYRALLNAQKRRDILQPDMDAFNKASHDLTLVVGAIDIEGERLKGEVRSLQVQAQNLQKRRQQLTQVETQADQLAEVLKSENTVQQAWQAAQVQLTAAQEAFTELKGRNERLTGDLAEVTEVLELLARPHAACPVCESDLSGTRHKTVVDKQEAKRQTLLQTKKELADEGRVRRQTLSDAQDAAKQCDAARADMASQKARWQQLSTQRDNLADELAGMGDVETQAAKMRQQWERGEFAAPERARRVKLEKELERLGLAKQEFETVTGTLQRLDAASKRFQNLQNAATSQEQQAAELRDLETVLADKREDVQVEQEKLAALHAKLTTHETVKGKAIIAENDLRRLEEERSRLKIREGTLTDAIKRGEEDLQKRKRREQTLAKIKDEKKMYDALALAFGRGGVQALIIENAIPELEEECNGLLASITDNAMQVRFNTTKITKTTKNQVETLDIVVHDDAGVRPYELFSGGESFRINFAIRIALSRLLARRSGARLQTLIMDEGFGSQDGKGREKLIEAIESIKDDFEKILVITHVEELKDAFQHRIEVTKDASGSHVHVL